MSVMFRRLLLALAALLVASVLTAGPASAYGSLTFWPKAPIAGEKTAVTGSLPVKVARPVQLQRYLSGAWSTIRWGNSASTGGYRFDIVAAAGSYRMIAPATSTRARYTGETVRLAVVAQSVTASAPGTAVSGAGITISSSATPVRSGRGVSLQRYDDGAWRDIAAGVEDSAGRTTFRTTAGAAGSASYRVKVAARNGAGAISSETKRVTITTSSPSPSATPTTTVSPSPSASPSPTTTASATPTGTSSPSPTTSPTTAPEFPDATAAVSRLTDTSPTAPTGANGVTYSSGPGNAMSTDGRWLVFQTNATNVIPGDGNDSQDSFLYDRQTGGVALIGRTSGGGFPLGGTSSPTISADGRWISFVGPAQLLGATGDSARVVYLWDRVNDQLRQVSPVNGNSPYPTASVARDGTHVVYVGASGRSGNSSNVYLWNRVTGSTVRITGDAMPVRGGRFAMPRVADGGAYVVYLGPVEGAGYEHLFRWRASDDTTTRIDRRASDGGVPTGYISDFAMSADARYVTWTPSGDDVVAGDGPLPGGDHSSLDLVVWDGATGTTRMVSRDVTSTPERSTGGGWVRMSADGRYVLHGAPATGDLNPSYVPERIDLVTGARTRIPGLAAGWGGIVGASADASVALSSSSGVYEAEDTNERVDLHAIDFGYAAGGSGRGFAEPTPLARTSWTAPTRPARSGYLVSDRANGTAAGGHTPSVSGDGRFTAFTSPATDIDLADADDPSWPPFTYDDVFVHDRSTGVSDRITDGLDGSGADKSAHSPTISADGRWVLYESAASNLVEGDTATDVNYDLFLWDRTTGTTRMVTRAPGETEHVRNFPMAGGALSPNGTYVAFWSDFNMDPEDHRVDDGYVRLNLWNRITGTTVRMVRPAPLQPGYSDDVPDFGAAPVSVADNGDVVFEREVVDMEQTFGGDSETAIYVWKAAGTGAVKRLVTGVRGDENPNVVGPEVSADGSTVVFSTAKAISPGDVNGVDDVYRHSLATGTTTLVSSGAAGVGDDVSLAPSVSADGSVVGFVSWAANLVGGEPQLLGAAYVSKAGVLKRIGLVDTRTDNRSPSRVAVSSSGAWIALDTEAWWTAPDTMDPEARDVYLHAIN